MDRKKIIVLICIGIVILLAVLAFLGWFFKPAEVTIITNLKEAEISIDGKLSGKTPVKRELKAGQEYTISAEQSGYEKAEEKIVPKRGKNEYLLNLTLKQLTQEEFSALPSDEKKEYERLSDAKTAEDETLLRERNPLVKQLPYSDPDLKFHIDYGGSIFQAIYYVTVYGYTSSDFTANKRAANSWISSKVTNFNSLKIEYRNESLPGNPNSNYQE